MLRCPKCGQTSKGMVKGEITRDYTLWIFKKKAVLTAAGPVVDLDKILTPNPVVRCLFCRKEAPVREWRAARLRPAADWDEEEDIGEISNPYALESHEVEDLDDLARVSENDPHGGDDDGSDD